MVYTYFQKFYIGEILSESVKNALETICMIGGFVILFSVICEILKSTNILSFFGNLFLPENMKNLGNGLFLGTIEITNGINIISQNITKEGVILACCLVSFSGLSILAQTASIVGKTDINFGIYIFSKILHSLISFIYCIICSPLINKFLNEKTEDVFNYFKSPVLKISLINFLISGIIIILMCVLTLYFNKRGNRKRKYKRFKRRF